LPDGTFAVNSPRGGNEDGIRIIKLRQKDRQAKQEHRDEGAQEPAFPLKKEADCVREEWSDGSGHSLCVPLENREHEECDADGDRRLVEQLFGPASLDECLVHSAGIRRESRRPRLKKDAEDEDNAQDGLNGEEDIHTQSVVKKGNGV